jgi:predicted transcriptional regulator
MKISDLGRLGLNNHEQEVYLTILKAGKIAPTRISQITGINRTTVYSVGKKLKKLGLVDEDYHGKTGYLMTDSPDRLLKMLAQEEKELAKRKELAAELLPDLAVLANKQNYSVPKLKFVEEESLSDFLYSETNKWNESGLKSDNTWWGYQDPSFLVHYGKWIEWCWQQNIPNRQVKLFSNGEAAEAELNSRFPERKNKPLSPDVRFDACLWVIGDYIIMVQTQVKPHYLVEICDAVLARNQRELFRALWQ